MPRQYPLNLANIANLDLGTVDAVFKAVLRKIVSDLNDRPNDKTKRKVKIEFGFIPVPDASGRDLEEVGVDVQITDSLPKTKTKVFRMLPKADGTLVFNADFADEPHQEPMFGDRRPIDPNSDH